MREKRKPSQGAKPARVREGRKDRADQPHRQYSQPSRNPQQTYTDKQFEQMLIDMYCTLKDFPSQIRYSYFVGPDGKLMTRSERRGAK